MNTKKLSLSFMLISVISVMLVSVTLKVEASDARLRAISEWNKVVSEDNDNKVDKVSEDKVSEDKISDPFKISSDKSTSSKSKYAKLKITFTDLGNFKGEVRVKVTNEEHDKVILKTTVKKVSKNNNVRTFKIKIGNNHVGDELGLDTSAITTEGGRGFWGFPLTFEKSMKIEASLEEIDCGIGGCD